MTHFVRTVKYSSHGWCAVYTLSVTGRADRHAYLHSDGKWRATAWSRNGRTGWFESEQAVEAAVEKWIKSLPGQQKD